MAPKKAEAPADAPATATKAAPAHPSYRGAADVYPDRASPRLVAGSGARAYLNCECVLIGMR